MEIYQVESKRRNSALPHLIITKRKRTARMRNIQKREGNDQRNFQVKPKQKILKMSRFPRIKGKFRWNQHQKVLIVILGVSCQLAFFFC